MKGRGREEKEDVFFLFSSPPLHPLLYTITEPSLSYEENGFLDKCLEARSLSWQRSAGKARTVQLHLADCYQCALSTRLHPHDHVFALCCVCLIDERQMHNSSPKKSQIRKPSFDENWLPNALNVDYVHLDGPKSLSQILSGHGELAFLNSVLISTEIIIECWLSLFSILTLERHWVWVWSYKDVLVFPFNFLQISNFGPNGAPATDIAFSFPLRSSDKKYIYYIANLDVSVKSRAVN